MEQTARRRHEVQVEEIEQELKDAITKCESLEKKSSEQASELTKALESMKEARVDAQGAHQEIQEARQIAAGKAFIMQSRYTSKRYFTNPSLEFSRRLCGTAKEYCECRRILPSRRGELNGVVLVAVPCTRASSAPELPAKADVQAAQGGRTGYEGRNSLSMVGRGHT